MPSQKYWEVRGTPKPQIEILCKLYFASLLDPPSNVSLISYADDCIVLASEVNIGNISANIID